MTRAAVLPCLGQIAQWALVCGADGLESTPGPAAVILFGRRLWQGHPTLSGASEEHEVLGHDRWPAAGFVDTEIWCLTELESGNAEKEVQP